ncbi:hypothetical protein, partial [Bradyrhizobium sp. Mp27]|uniref:hypothetical protein n=1 Tax=Bradyrhizobium sp. Mp27 TaxID=3042157 RepID=UPI00248C7635
PVLLQKIKRAMWSDIADLRLAARPTLWGVEEARGLLKAAFSVVGQYLKARMAAQPEARGGFRCSRLKTIACAAITLSPDRPRRLPGARALTNLL